MFEHEVDNSRKRKVGAGGFLQEKLVGGGSSSDGKGGKQSRRQKRTHAPSSSATSSKESESSKGSINGRNASMKKSGRQLREERALKRKRNIY